MVQVFKKVEGDEPKDFKDTTVGTIFTGLLTGYGTYATTQTQQEQIRLEREKLALEQQILAMKQQEQQQQQESGGDIQPSGDSKGKSPAWVMPVAIVGGIALVGGIAYFAFRK